MDNLKKTVRRVIPMLHKITTRLNLGSVSSGSESRVSDLHWSVFLQDTRLNQLYVLSSSTAATRTTFIFIPSISSMLCFNQLYVLLHVKDLLQNLYTRISTMRLFKVFQMTSRCAGAVQRSERSASL